MRPPGQSDWSREDIERGLAAWLRLGTSTAAAAETGIAAGTLRSRRHRHPELACKIREAHDCAMKELREEIAKDAAEGIREAVLVARKALRGETVIDAKGAAAILRALATVDTSLDKIGRLDASTPTDIVEDRRSDSDLIGEIERALKDPTLRAAFEEHREAAA